MVIYVTSRQGGGVAGAHLLFVNGLLAFRGSSQFQMAYLSLLVMWIETILGLEINLDLEKCKLVSGCCSHGLKFSQG